MSSLPAEPPAPAQPAAAAAAAAAPPKPVSGVKMVLRYTGIPPSWLDKRPKLPSRNWMIFLSVTSTLVGYYAYDRRECARITQEYVDKVKDMAEEKLDPLAQPRKVKVYGAKWPGDEEYTQAVKHFRKYVKPVLVAAAVDFETVDGKRLGDIERLVAEETRKRRRMDAGIDDFPEAVKLVPTHKSLAERQQRDLEGGIVIVGRNTLKEFMAGLKRGWTQGLNKVDQNEVLSQILDDDAHFDEPIDNDESEDGAAPVPAPAPSTSHSPVFAMATYKSQKEQEAVAAGDDAVPSTIPPYPPLLLVPFHNRIGFTAIPMMIWDWFNRRYWVQSGCEAGYRIVMNQTRPIDVPYGAADATELSDSDDAAPVPQGDLDFDKDGERLYKGSLKKIPKETEEAREAYYKKLPEKLATARALARGTREPTADEINSPPPTEVELRAERLKKERKWRSDVDGWNLVKPSTPVEWDERLRNALRVFKDPSDSSNNE